MSSLQSTSIEFISVTFISLSTHSEWYELFMENQWKIKKNSFILWTRSIWTCNTLSFPTVCNVCFCHNVVVLSRRWTQCFFFTGILVIFPWGQTSLHAPLKSIDIINPFYEVDINRKNWKLIGSNHYIGKIGTCCRHSWDYSSFMLQTAFDKVQLRIPVPGQPRPLCYNAKTKQDRTQN